MTAFTRLGCAIWDWPPFVDLPDSARVFWLALYSTAEAKRHAPGLWQGGIPAMADASRQHPDVVIHALDKLLEREMVEYDARARVLRLCMLPDAGEFPSNGKVILSWWTRFQSVPECGVRDAHVTTLRWIIDEGGRLSRKGVSMDHENAWRDTFGKVVIPATRHRGVRRLADDSDTGTRVQPSLFPAVAGAMSPPPGSDRHPQPSAYGIHESPYPQGSSQPVDRSAALHQPKEIRAPETVSDTVSDTNRIPDPGSRILDPSPEGGRGGGHEHGKPVLTLVPPYTAGHVLSELAKGPWDSSLDRACWEAVGAMIPAWVALGIGVADFTLLGQHNHAEQRRWNARILLGCDIATEVASARRMSDWRDARAAALLKQHL